MNNKQNRLTINKLSTLCSDIIDCSHSTPVWRDRGIRVIRNFNLNEGSLDFSKGFFVDEKTYLERTKRAVPEAEDIVISREAPMGTVAIIPNDLKCCLGQRLVLLKVDNDICSSSYLLFALMSDFVQSQFNKIGSTVSNLTIPELKETKIPLVKNHKSIGKLLESIANKIQVNKQINDNLQKQLCLIYENMMRNAQYGSVEGTFTIASKLTDVLTGKEDANFASSKGKYKFFTCSNDTLNCNEYVFDNSAIMIAGNGDFNVKHYSGKFNAYQRTYVLIPNHKYYGLLYLASLYQINSFKSASSGSIVKFVTKGDIENISVFVPKDERILNELNRLLVLQENNQLENEELSSLRDWLLPMLMNGQATIED